MNGPLRLVLRLALLGSFWAPAAWGQETAPSPPPESDYSTRHFLRGAYQVGWVLQNNDFVRGLNSTGEPIRFVNAGRLDVGWQTGGKQDWHHTYGFPAYGIGIYTAAFSNRGLVGALTAVDGFFIWPLHRSRTFGVNGEFRLGLAEDFAVFAPVNNPFQEPIAPGRSIHLDIGCSLTYRLSNRFDLGGGATFAHFSNGGTVQPNYDLNTLAPYVSLDLQLEGTRPAFVRRPLPPYEGAWELALAGALGTTSLAFVAGEDPAGGTLVAKDYNIANLTATLHRQVNRMSKVGGGLDITYDGSVGADYNPDTGRIEDSAASRADKMSLGIYVGYEHVVNRASVLVQVGATVLRSRTERFNEDFYQRLGFKYHVFDNTFVGMSTRFNRFTQSQYVEWTVGQRWRW